jgi:hypothetical protein
MRRPRGSLIDIIVASQYIMTAWSDLVGKLVKENPGTPLNIILPMAKKQYVKPGSPIQNEKKQMRKTNRKRNKGRDTRRKQRR